MTRQKLNCLGTHYVEGQSRMRLQQPSRNLCIHSFKMSAKNHEDISICDNQLKSLTVRELNRLLKSSRFSKYQVQQMKQRRRTLKNRGYAASCRTKRFERKGELEKQKKEELKGIEVLNHEIYRFKDLISQVRGRIKDCLLFAKQHNINVQICPDYSQGKDVSAKQI